jgi:hypothetical protein
MRARSFPLVTLAAAGLSAFAFTGPASAAAGPVILGGSSPSEAPLVRIQALEAYLRPSYVTVRAGQTLSGIAKAEYGSARWWPQLWRQNRKTIRDPGVIRKGERLLITVRWKHPPEIPRQFRPHAVLVTHRGAAPQPAPAPSPAPQPSPAPPVSPSSGFEACVIQAESGGDPTAYNSSSGASGLYGFLLSTWDSLGVGYPGGAYTAPPSVQHQGFLIEYARAGTAPWAPYDGC